MVVAGGDALAIEAFVLGVAEGGVVPVLQASVTFTTTLHAS